MASTMYHYGSPPLTADMSPLAALRAVGAWASAMPSIDRLLVPSLPVVDEEDDDTDLAFHGDLTTLLRRDMRVARGLSSTSALVLGLLVPLEITNIACGAGLGGVLDLEFVAHAAPGVLHSAVLLGDTLADMLGAVTMLAPAMAAYLHAHSRLTVDSLAEVTGLGRAAAAPRVPKEMLDAAGAVPCAGLNGDEHIGDVLVRARNALERTGYAAPSLEGIDLEDMPLQRWMDLHARVFENTVAWEAEIEARVQALKRGLDEEVEAIVTLMRKRRRQLLTPWAHK